MRGYSLLAFLLGAALLTLFTSCVLEDLPVLDVPPCYSEQECTRIAASGEAEYDYLVGRTWYYANSALKVFEAAHEICSLKVDLNDLPDKLSALQRDAGEDMLAAMKYADTANLSALSSLTYMQQSLEDAGIECVPGTEVHAVYSTIVSTLEGVKRSQPTTPLASVLLSALSRKNDWQRLGVQGTDFVDVYAPALGVVARWNVTSTLLIKLAAQQAGEVVEEGMDADEYINVSVGVTHSVRRYYTSLASEYRRAIDTLFARASSMQREAHELMLRAEELSSTLDSRALRELNGNVLSTFVPKEVVTSVLPSDLSDYARVARTSARRTYAELTTDLMRFSSRDRNYLCYFSRAERQLETLRSMVSDLETRKEALSTIASLCKEYLSSYSPITEYARYRLKGVVAAMGEASVYDALSLCAQGVEIVRADMKYSSLPKMLDACEKRASAYPDYACAGDIVERYECCEAFLKRKEEELRSSEKYSEYLELLSSIEALLPYTEGYEDDYFSLNPDPDTPGELEEDFLNALSLYSTMLSDAGKAVTPVVHYEGYVDSEEMSEVNMIVYLSEPGVPVSATVEVPFKYAAYRVLEANGPLVRVSGGKIFLKGTGAARILFVTYPHLPETEQMGETDGRAILRVVHDAPFPLRYEFSGEALSLSPGVNWDGTALLFSGPGTALIAKDTIEMDIEERGNTALVVLRNVSGEKYSGDVFIPVEGNGPHYCTPVANGLLCRINLDPFEQRAIMIEGKPVSSPAPALEPAIPVLSAPEPVSEKRMKTLKEKVSDLLSTLRDYLSRAQELNVVHLLPFSDTILSTYERLAETNDTYVLSTIYSSLSEHEKYVRNRARAEVEALLMAGDDDTAPLAKQALLTGDYVLALALAESVKPKYLRGGTAEIPTTHVAVALFLLILVAVALRAPQKKKRIPRL